MTTSLRALPPPPTVPAGSVQVPPDIAKQIQTAVARLEYTKVPEYIDNVTGAHLDLLSLDRSKRFWVDHGKEKTAIYMDYLAIRNEMGIRHTRERGEFGLLGGTALEVTYWRDRQNKIWPSKLHPATVPTISMLVRHIDKQIEGKIEDLVALQFVIAVFGVAGGAAVTAPGTGARPIRARRSGLRVTPVARVPTLKPGSPNQMLDEAFKHVNNFRGSAKAKADLFDELAQQVSARHSDWGFIRQTAADGGDIFFGNGPHFLVVKPDGTLWKGILDGTTRQLPLKRVGTQYMPDYAKLKPVTVR